MVNETVVWVVNGAVIRAVYSAVAGHGAVNRAVYLAVYGAGTPHTTSSHPGLMLYLKEVARCRT